MNFSEETVCALLGASAVDMDGYGLIFSFEKYTELGTDFVSVSVDPENADPEKFLESIRTLHKEGYGRL